MNSARLGLACAVLAALLFSFKSVLIKLAYADGADAESLFMWRMLFCLPAYVLLWWIDGAREERPPMSWRTAVLAGGVGVVGHGLSSYLDMLGLVHLSAQLERLILFTYPMLVTLLGAYFFGIAASGRALAAGAASQAGMALALVPLMDGSAGAWVPGVPLVFGAALTYALYQLWARPLVHALGAMRFTCLAMTASALFALCVHAVFGPGLAMPSPRGGTLAWAALLAIFSTVLPGLLLSAALRRIGAQENAAIGAAGPALTMLLAAACLGEALTAHAVLGCTVAVGATAWLALSEARSRTPVLRAP